MDELDEIKFCEEYCGTLSKQQKNLIKKYVAENRFLGVGHPPATLNFYPLYKDGWVKKIIFPDGNYMIPSDRGIIYYNKSN